MTRELEFRPGLVAHASGALWVPAVRALLVADTHLGYAWAQRRRGELGPLIEGGARERLEAVVTEFAPAQVVLVGDVVHAPRPSDQERAVVEATLVSLLARTRVVFVRGNHDRAFAQDYHGLGLEVVEQWREAGVCALHGDRLPEDPCADSFFALGHVHPAVTVHDAAGAGRRIPVFVVGERGVVLPAFSPFAAGFRVNYGVPPEVGRFLGQGTPVAIAATGTRVMRLGSLRTGPRKW
jgi:uncharacterized protein